MSEAASLLLDFVNTRDIAQGTDELDAPGKLAAWLAARHLVQAGPSAASAATLATAVTLREGLRAALLAHHGPGPRALPAELDDVLAGLPVRVSLGAAARPALLPALLPAGGGIAGGLSGLAAAIMATAADGTWPRLKVCQEDTCRWAFLDTSKNRSRSWCSMQVCGNRTKTRAYRARRKNTAAGQ
jgi:predicted RNA-binding Zn ribbon-like protein